MLSILLSVPWWNLVIIPCSLIGVLCFIFCPYVGSKLLVLGHNALLINWHILAKLSNYPYRVNYSINSGLELFILELLVVFILLPNKYLKIAGILFLFPWKINNFQLKFTLLDVGQGLATVIQTPNYTLIYDTGPNIGKYSNAGERIILPFLRFNKINEVDKVIISHGDNDHRGGLKGLVDKIKIKEIITSEPERLGVKHEVVKGCLVNKNWTWDQVNFQMYQADALKGNNGSCVLRVYTDKYSFLLPGDLEQAGEKGLLRQKVNLKSKVLVAPHHGSRGAINQEFFNQVGPELVLFPVGYKNRFNFPYFKFHEFFSKKTRFLETGKVGSIEMIINGYYSKLILHRYKYRTFWSSYYEKLTKLK